MAEDPQDDFITLRISYRRPRLPPHVHYRLAIREALGLLEARGFAPDVIHAHYYIAGSTAVRLGKRLSVPVVISEHSSSFPAGAVTGRHLRRARRALERADLVCPVSAFLASAIARSGVQARTRVLTNTVDTKQFRPGPPTAKPADGPVRLAFAAILRAGKGLDDLLQALAGLDDGRGWHLDVVGDGPARQDMEALAIAHGIAHRVTFHGLLARAELAAVLRSADLFVLPSLAETQGAVLIEAMACGVPVLSTRVGGIPEIVGEESGTLVPASDPDKLRAALRSMLNQLGRYDGARIAQRAEERFGYAAVGRQLHDIYCEVAA